MSNRVNGVVKWFKDDKGFGFIEHEGEDFFVHFRNIKCDGFKSLPKGGAVSFIITKGKKGMQAEEVELL